jgi:hypothetical protein
MMIIKTFGRFAGAANAAPADAHRTAIVMATTTVANTTFVRAP